MSHRASVKTHFSTHGTHGDGGPSLKTVSTRISTVKLSLSSRVFTSDGLWKFLV